MTGLVNELVAQPGEGEVLLVLDDYHLKAQQVHGSVTFLLDHLPEELHLVLASRADPLLPMARWRARRKLAEVRTAELRFTAAEAATLLREAVGSELPEDAVAALVSRAPRGGRPACSWPASRCGASRMWPRWWRRSPAATATAWTF